MAEKSKARPRPAVATDNMERQVEVDSISSLSTIISSASAEEMPSIDQRNLLMKLLMQYMLDKERLKKRRRQQIAKWKMRKVELKNKRKLCTDLNEEGVGKGEIMKLIMQYPSDMQSSKKRRHYDQNEVRCRKVMKVKVDYKRELSRTYRHLKNQGFSKEEIIEIIPDLAPLHKV